MSELYQKLKSTINQHLKNIFAEGELVESEVMTKFGISEFSRQRPTQHYNLYAILAVGYRVKSHCGIHFRNWATNILKEYMQKGFVINDKLLKQEGGGLYFKELIENNPQVTLKEMENAIGKIVEKLSKENPTIHYIESSKSGHWEIND